MKIIPAIDVQNGSCVRLRKGDFAQVTEYSRQPSEVARNYAAMGFDYLHIVDLDGARLGSLQNADCVRAIMDSTAMTVQIGGGIRDSAALEYWLRLGVRRCVVGSIAITDPATVRAWLDQYTADRLVLALDVQIDADGMPMVATHGWTETSGTVLWDCVDGFLDSGLRHVLCTDVSRDGALAGPNIELYREFARRYPSVELQASGGVRDIEDLRRTAETGAAGAITGRALLDGRISQREISSFRPGA